MVGLVSCLEAKVVWTELTYFGVKEIRAESTGLDEDLGSGKMHLWNPYLYWSAIVSAVVNRIRTKIESFI